VPSAFAHTIYGALQESHMIAHDRTENCLTVFYKIDYWRKWSCRIVGHSSLLPPAESAAICVAGDLRLRWFDHAALHRVVIIAAKKTILMLCHSTREDRQKTKAGCWPNEAFLIRLDAFAIHGKGDRKNEGRYFWQNEPF